MRYKILFGPLLMWLALPGGVLADSPVPAVDQTEITEDGEYIFVMLVPNCSTTSCQDKTIRSKYRQSGLYKNDGSITPLWTVDWYGYVELSSDCKHLVRWGSWPTRGNYAEVALAFYENGHEIANYRVDQLVSMPLLLPQSVSHYQWLRSSSFDGKRNRLSLDTNTFDHYVFDVTTGRVIDGWVLPIPRCCIFPIGLVIVGMVVMLLVSRMRLRQRDREILIENAVPWWDA